MAMSFGPDPVIDNTIESVPNEVLVFEVPEPPEEEQPVPVPEPETEPSHPETTPADKTA